MRYKIGDIVRLIFDSEKTAMVCGYGKGHCFSSELTFESDDDVVLAMRENGTVFVFKSTNCDWVVVNHVDMTDIFTHIVDAKEI